MRMTRLAAFFALGTTLILPAAAFDEADALFGKIAALCGNAYAGRVTTNDARDADMQGQTLIVHVRGCTDSELRLPFHVGEDRSRTWVISRTEGGGLRLKHDHRHKDGSPDTITMYGGDAAPPGTPVKQSFPADAETKTLFLANDLAAAVENVWSLEITPGTALVYELRRPERHFRVEFDLTKPVEAPPPPWGG